MTRMTGGRAVVEALVREKVDTVFGIPGVHTLEVYDAFHERPEIRHIVTRHEGGAGHMADGYARATGKPGVALVITGPGVTNITTALGQAFSDSAPMLLISSQNETQFMDRDVGVLHQLKDQLAVTEGCTAWNRRILDPAEIPGAVADAMAYLRTHRPRPVHLDIPLDVLNAEADMVFSDDPPSELFAPCPQDVAKIAEILVQSQRPLIWLGGGAAVASVELTELVQHLDAAVVMTCAGKGVVSEKLPQSIGNQLRFIGNRLGSSDLQQFISSCDVALVVGSELAAMETASGTLQFPPNMIRVDVDLPREDRLYSPQLEVKSDARLFVQELLTQLKVKTPKGALSKPSFMDEVAQLRHTFAQVTGNQDITDIVSMLRAELAPEDIVVCDMTMLCYRASGIYPAFNPRTFLFPRGFGTLGWSVPAALGAKLALPEHKVVALVGDGGFLFTGQELSTAVKYNISLPIVLLNNECYGVVALNQLQTYGRTIATDICNPDFVKYAHAFGAKGVKLESLSQLPQALQEAFTVAGPTIIEICVDF